MIYVILGAMIIAMAALSKAERKTKIIAGSIGAFIMGSFIGMAISCSLGGNFSKAEADLSYDYATYKGNNSYETRNWGEIQIDVENPDKTPEVGQTVYLYRYHNADEPLDLLVAPWKLFRERWYL